MKKYIYDTHVHTSEVSRCASISGADTADFFKSLGYSGFFVTDHFFNANTTVPKSGMSWTDRVDMFQTGYLAAKKRGDEIGIDVFFGWEYTFGGSDLLTYGLGAEWLLENPDVCEWHVKDYCDRVHNAGGYIVHAHPFREADYINMIRLIPRKVDAVEIFNANHDGDFENNMAEFYASSYNLAVSGGSDFHFTNQYRFGGIKTDEPIKSVSDFINAVKSRNVEIVCVDNNIVK